MKMYINGQLSTSNLYDNLPLMQGEGLCFGNFYGLNNNIDGMIDDIGIWERSLSLEEMNNLYNVPNTGSIEGTVPELLGITPNPTRDCFTVSGILEVPGSKLFVFMYSLSGNLVLQETIDSGNPVILIKNRISNGFYIIKITDKAGNTWQQKLLVTF